MNEVACVSDMIIIGIIFFAFLGGMIIGGSR